MIAERMAKAAWEEDHDGCWEDHGDGQDVSRDIYLRNMKTALAELQKTHAVMEIGVRKAALSTTWTKQRGAAVTSPQRGGD